ncbi:MAG: TonB-dependent receptor [Myxococcota bacterium]
MLLVVGLGLLERPGLAQSAPGVDLAEEAQVSFELGVQAIQRGEYLTGLQHLLQSNRLAPNKNVLYNIAGAYEALGRNEQAYQYYTDYVALETDAARRADGERGLTRLASRVALVFVSSDPPGATIYVDRRDLGARGVTPRTIAVPPGDHVVMLEAGGYAAADRTTRAVRGSESSVSLTLDRLLGQVRLFGEPAGATIRLEGADDVIGTVPSTVEVPVGSAVLEIASQGYATRKVVVDVATDEVAQADATLALLTGRVIVDAPGRPGALIEIDGEAVAFTPQVVDVPVGHHTLRVSAAGYDVFSSEIDVSLDQAITVDARLRGNVLDPLVVSASRTAELLSEAPVPVTVVTAAMIRSIGARNLKDILTIYVPGMTDVTDHNELNVAMRGVYASSQQKILVMVDGHRLNSRAYSMAAPDYSVMVSPDRIKQIEILRGPGSAAYGNIAYTAVVNIITNDGQDVGGLVARAGGGDHGQLLGSVVYGATHTDDDDLVVWGQLYRALGEEYPIAKVDDYAVDSDADGVVEPHAGVAILGGTRDPASYDVGFRYLVGDLHLFANSRYGKHTEPFTAGGATGAVYDYDGMRTIQTVGPGLGSLSNSLELGWAPSLNDHSGLDFSTYLDTNEIKGNLTTGWDTHLVLGWQEVAGGGVAQYTLDYDALGHGSVVVGGQVDLFRLQDSLFVSGTDGDWQVIADTDDREVLLPGSESTYSAFVQVKHALFSGPSGDPLILNVGGRFDDKIRREGDPKNDIPDQDDILNFSPRLAVIVRPAPVFAAKLSYAESFVDAPYWYRYNNLASYAGAVSLKPEHLRAAQLTPELTLLDGRFKSTTNLAYQNVYDVIYRDNAAQPGDPFYINAGSLESAIVEEELAFVESVFRARANATWQQVLDVERYEAPDHGSRINNVPSVVANLVLDANPLQALDQSLWTNLTLRYVGEQAAPIRTVSLSHPDLDQNLTNEEPAHALVDVGARLDRFLGGWSIDGRIYNLLDTRYSQGGSTLFPYPQPGRWFLVNLEWAIDPHGGRDRGGD